MDHLQKSVDEKQRQIDQITITNNEEILNLQSELNASETKIDNLSKSLNDAKLNRNEEIQEMQKWKLDQKQHAIHIVNFTYVSFSKNKTKIKKQRGEIQKSPKTTFLT